MVDYDDTQSIGQRYRRQDEIGTPLCVTVDFDSLDDDAVTIRDRDTTEQVRVPIDRRSSPSCATASASDGSVERERQAEPNGAGAPLGASPTPAPPIASTSSRTMARPRPLELSAGAADGGRRTGVEHVRQIVERSDARAVVVDGEHRPSARSPSTLTTSKRAYFSAFSIRLAATWASRSWSACTTAGPAMVGPAADCRARPHRAEALARHDSQRREVDPLGWSENVGACSLARSSRSATSRSSRRASVRITAADRGGSAAPSLIASA